MEIKNNATLEFSQNALGVQQTQVHCIAIQYYKNGSKQHHQHHHTYIASLMVSTSLAHRYSCAGTVCGSGQVCKYSHELQRPYCVLDDECANILIVHNKTETWVEASVEYSKFVVYVINYGNVAIKNFWIGSDDCTLQFRNNNPTVNGGELWSIQFDSFHDVFTLPTYVTSIPCFGSHSFGYIIKGHTTPTLRILGVQTSTSISTTPEDLKSFQQWLSNKNTYLNPSIDIVDLGPPFGRSMVANTNIKKDEILVEIPKGIMMTPKSMIKNLPRFIIDWMDEMKISRTDQQAIAIIYSILHEDSYWYEYVSILPKQFTTTVYFTREEMTQLQASPVHRFTEMRLNGVHRHYDTTISRLRFGYEGGEDDSTKTKTKSQLDAMKEFKDDRYTLDQFKWALGCVWSRAFSLSEEDGGMVPLADMFNADTVISRSKVHPKISASSPSLVYTASQDIEAGEQIFTPYGVYKTLGSGQMLMDYGFIHEDGSSADSTIVTVAPIPPSEPLYDLKRHLMQSNGIESEEFTITKNKLAKELFLFARIKSINKKESDQASAHFMSTQRHSMLNPRNEKAALRLLSNLISRHLDAYQTTIDQDNQILKEIEKDKTNTNHSSVTFNTINAIKLRLMEKNILNSFLKSINSIRDIGGN
ncbi:hypothetical protein DFA_00957 [Cavenderia fasciculata]|uniref:SET domain-containing protein n=1 Tax=Cavenderia fasciculata TaxID=261658 RepID=F4PUR3_CACFS|nr:uncharacterized protein DFA_00957 [Cavenderia fasciculata]EGG21082.1 hypothetical protein DFA_00957 [Cavenderia fasciculata]|eukprot:XP_004358932.1 hypothetical protein DFA_00957 [Cavenderia fasciculata]